MKRKKTRLVLPASLSVVMLISNAFAADFLYFWRASTDPSVNAYGIYQRSGGSSYVKIEEVSVQDLELPDTPSLLITGLAGGNTYWFAVTSIAGSGAESEFSSQTCITVNGQIVECDDDDNDDDGTTVFISCFIAAAGF